VTADDLIDYEAAARKLGVSVSFLEKRVRAGHITPTRLGRRVLFCAAELQRYVAEHTRADIGAVEVESSASPRRAERVIEFY
jgi:excisionase family DNA binding protein